MQRNVLKGVMHVQSCCLAHKTNCFLKSSLWLSSSLYNWYSAKKTMWFIGVEVEQETSAPPPKKNPGSAPAVGFLMNFFFCPPFALLGRLYVLSYI